MKYTIIIFLFTLFVLHINCSCNENQVLFINDDNTTECKDCPSGCAICYRSIGQQISCAYCDFGFYQDIDGFCKPCYENCELCYGPEITQCEELKKSYYIDEKYNPPQIQKCTQEGCLFCSDNKCVQCDKQYIETPLDSETYLDDEFFVNCTKCTLDNCLICQERYEFDVHTYIECVLCDQGYGLIDNKCQKCIDNCSYCEDNINNCKICADGYLWDSEQKLCLKPNDQNCTKMKNKKCQKCDNHFIKDKKTETCIVCSSIINKCNFCTKNKNKYICESCMAGYRLNDQGQCVECPENCVHCNKEKCQNCKQGMYYDKQQNKCLTCTLQNCDKCYNKEICENCREGYYIDKQQNCQRCKNNCLQCTQDGEKCISCPVSYYMLEEEFISETKNTGTVLDIFMGFLGLLENQPIADMDEYKSKSSCVEKCPQDIEGQKVSIDHLERKCIVKFEESSPIVSLPKLQKKDDINNSMKQLLNSYQKEIEKIQKISLEKKNEIYSEECNYNGTLEYIITGYLEYYICICNKGYLGDNCEISYSLFQSTQKKLQEILKILQRSFFSQNQKQKKVLLDTILLIKQFRFGRPVAQQIIQLLQNFIQKDKQIDDFQSLYAIYDSIILSIYDQLEDQKKYQQAPIFMSMDTEAEKEKLINVMQTVFLKLFESIQDHKYENSFLQNYQKDKNNYNTFSFKISEYKMKDIKNNNNLIVPTPNIDSAQKIQIPTQVSLQFEQQNNKKLISHIQLINLSAQLFQNYFQNTESVCATNVIYFKIIDPQNSNHKFSDVKINNITIQFPLLFLPPQQNLEQTFICIGFDFYSTFEDIIGQLNIQDIQGNIQKASCTFQIDDRFMQKNIFFAIKTKLRI